MIAKLAMARAAENVSGGASAGRTLGDVSNGHAPYTNANTRTAVTATGRTQGRRARYRPYAEDAGAVPL